MKVAFVNARYINARRQYARVSYAERHPFTERFDSDALVSQRFSNLD